MRLAGNSKVRILDDESIAHVIIDRCFLCIDLKTKTSRSKKYIGVSEEMVALGIRVVDHYLPASYTAG